MQTLLDNSKETHHPKIPLFYETNIMPILKSDKHMRRKITVYFIPN